MAQNRPAVPIQSGASYNLHCNLESVEFMPFVTAAKDKYFTFATTVIGNKDRSEKFAYSDCGEDGSMDLNNHPLTIPFKLSSRRMMPVVEIKLSCVGSVVCSCHATRIDTLFSRQCCMLVPRYSYRYIVLLLEPLHFVLLLEPLHFVVVYAGCIFGFVL